MQPFDCSRSVFLYNDHRLYLPNRMRKVLVCQEFPHKSLRSEVLIIRKHTMALRWCSRSLLSASFIRGAAGIGHFLGWTLQVSLDPWPFFFRYVCSLRGQQGLPISARHCCYFKSGWIASDRTGWPPLLQHPSSSFPHTLFSDIWTAAATRGQISARFRAESR